MDGDLTRVVGLPCAVSHLAACRYPRTIGSADAQTRDASSKTNVSEPASRSASFLAQR